MMIQEFYKLGYDMALSEVGLADRPVTKLGWIAPVVGGLAGAVAAPWILPHLGAKNRTANPFLGALIGAGIGASGGETLRAFSKSVEPRLEQNMIESLDAMQAAIKAVEAAEAKRAISSLTQLRP
jgi:hypothetical protein